MIVLHCSFVSQAHAVVFSRNSFRMETCAAILSGQADVPADLYQYIGDPRAPGDPLLGTLGYRQPQDPAASRAYQAARGLSTAQASSSSQQPAAASAASAAAASAAGPSWPRQWPRPPPPPPPPGSRPEAVGEPQEVE